MADTPSKRGGRRGGRRGGPLALGATRHGSGEASAPVRAREPLLSQHSGDDNWGTNDWGDTGWGESGARSSSSYYTPPLGYGPPFSPRSRASRLAALGGKGRTFLVISVAIFLFIAMTSGLSGSRSSGRERHLTGAGVQSSSRDGFASDDLPSARQQQRVGMPQTATSRFSSNSAAAAASNLPAGSASSASRLSTAAEDFVSETERKDLEAATQVEGVAGSGDELGEFLDGNSLSGVSAAAGVSKSRTGSDHTATAVGDAMSSREAMMQQLRQAGGLPGGQAGKSGGVTSTLTADKPSSAFASTSTAAEDDDEWSPHEGSTATRQRDDSFSAASSSTRIGTGGASTAQTAHRSSTVSSSPRPRGAMLERDELDDEEDVRTTAAASSSTTRQQPANDDYLPVADDDGDEVTTKVRQSATQTAGATSRPTVGQGAATEGDSDDYLPTEDDGGEEALSTRANPVAVEPKPLGIAGRARAGTTLRPGVASSIRGRVDAADTEDENDADDYSQLPRGVVRAGGVAATAKAAVAVAEDDYTVEEEETKAESRQSGTGSGGVKRRRRARPQQPTRRGGDPGDAGDYDYDYQGEKSVSRGWQGENQAEAAEKDIEGDGSFVALKRVGEGAEDEDYTADVDDYDAEKGGVEKTGAGADAETDYDDAGLEGLRQSGGRDWDGEDVAAAAEGEEEELGVRRQGGNIRSGVAKGASLRPGAAGSRLGSKGDLPSPSLTQGAATTRPAGGLVRPVGGSAGSRIGYRAGDGDAALRAATDRLSSSEIDSADAQENSDELSSDEGPRARTGVGSANTTQQQRSGGAGGTAHPKGSLPSAKFPVWDSVNENSFDPGSQVEGDPGEDYHFEEDTEGVATPAPGGVHRQVSKPAVVAGGAAAGVAKGDTSKEYDADEEKEKELTSPDTSAKVGVQQGAQRPQEGAETAAAAKPSSRDYDAAEAEGGDRDEEEQEPSSPTSTATKLGVARQRSGSGASATVSTAAKGAASSSRDYDVEGHEEESEEPPAAVEKPAAGAATRPSLQRQGGVSASSAAAAAKGAVSKDYDAEAEEADSGAVPQGAKEDGGDDGGAATEEEEQNIEGKDGQKEEEQQPSSGATAGSSQAQRVSQRSGAIRPRERHQQQPAAGTAAQQEDDGLAAAAVKPSPVPAPAPAPPPPAPRPAPAPAPANQTSNTTSSSAATTTSAKAKPTRDAVSNSTTGGKSGVSSSSAETTESPHRRSGSVKGDGREGAGEKAELEEGRSGSGGAKGKRSDGGEEDEEEPLANSSSSSSSKKAGIALPAASKAVASSTKDSAAAEAAEEGDEKPISGSSKKSAVAGDADEEAAAGDVDEEAVTASSSKGKVGKQRPESRSSGVSSSSRDGLKRVKGKRRPTTGKGSRRRRLLAAIPSSRGSHGEGRLRHKGGPTTVGGRLQPSNS